MDARCGLKECHSAAAAACACSVLYGSHAKAVNRRNLGALCVRGACCAACVWLGHTLLSPEQDCICVADHSRLGQDKQHTQRPRQCAALSRRPSSRRRQRGCIGALPTLRRMPLPAFAAASPWHGLATRTMPLARQ